MGLFSHSTERKLKLQINDLVRYNNASTQMGFYVGTDPNNPDNSLAMNWFDRKIVDSVPTATLEMLCSRKNQLDAAYRNGRRHAQLGSSCGPPFDSELLAAYNKGFDDFKKEFPD